MTRPSVAIVGAGIAGLGAARALAGRADVTVYEAAPTAGGHVHTAVVDGVPVDLGFIVFSRPSYPRFTALLAELGVRSRPTAMAFSVAVPDGDGRLEWSSASPAGWFAQRRRLASPRHWRFLGEVARLIAVGRRDLGTDRTRRATLDEWLRGRAIHPDVRDRFAVPLASALWSLAPARCGGFPAETFLRFLDNHGMLRLTRPDPWRTVVGGSATYVRALLAAGGFAVRTGAAVTAIHRDGRGVTLVIDGREHRYDRVVVATAAPVAMRLLAAPTAGEVRWLAPLATSENRTVLHGDASVMPAARAAWASWNYAASDGPAHITYWMNRLQGLPEHRPYLVTLNPAAPLAAIDHEARFHHPQYDFAALDAHAALPRLQGEVRTYFAGAWTGFGFHEDGLRSGQLAAARLLADEGA